MSREEIREKLKEAILECRITARRTADMTLPNGALKTAYELDDAAIGEVWRLIEELG